MLDIPGLFLVCRLPFLIKYMAFISFSTYNNYKIFSNFFCIPFSTQKLFPIIKLSRNFLYGTFNLVIFSQVYLTFFLQSFLYLIFDLKIFFSITKFPQNFLYCIFDCKIFSKYKNFSKFVRYILRLCTNKLLIYPFYYIRKWGKDGKGSYGISRKMPAVFTNNYPKFLKKICSRKTVL